ncbi:MAG: metal-dependent transcriptional regulator [Flavobacteriaceae bacterium]|nr:metal-dependent transcriptional regulator [Flavobacteriaceae bacterium]
MTRSEENYIKTIYHLGDAGMHSVPTNAIASQLKTQPSSVTDMIKKLSDKKYVHYKKYRGVYLSEKGINAALTIIRKHRLWEVFLAEKLGFNWDEVHDVAEQLEHIKSEKLIDKLDAFLNFPKYDPHGDPIPGKNGELAQRSLQLLSSLQPNDEGICVGVKDSSVTFLKFLDKHNISLGDHIKILDAEEFDESLTIQIDNKNLHISKRIATNLFIKPVRE